MLVPLVIVAAIAAGLLVLLVLARQRVGVLTAEGTELSAKLEKASAELSDAEQKIGELTGQSAELKERVADLDGQLTEATDALRKRTELADAQAEQIDALSGARDDLRAKLNAAEEQIVTLTARPEVVVGESGDDPGVETLWDLEVARSERTWRTSVAIDPLGEVSPFEATDDPVRTAIEIEAAALREDVGALIAIDWKAEPVESPSRRILVVRVAQELLAQASRAPGAARLVATDGDDGALTLAFAAVDDGGPTLNLIPPAISTDVLDVRSDDGLTVTVPADQI